MKAINVYVDDLEYTKLKEVKGNRSWRVFLLTLIPTAPLPPSEPIPNPKCE